MGLWKSQINYGESESRFTYFDSVITCSVRLQNQCKPQCSTFPSALYINSLLRQVEFTIHVIVMLLYYVAFHTTELCTRHFSWTRPGETFTKPDPRSPTESLARPDRPLICSTMFQEFNVKKRSWVALFIKTVVSMQHKDCIYQMLAKCIRGLIRTGLNSDDWTVFILKNSSRPALPARVLDPTQCIRVQYCYNSIPAGQSWSWSGIIWLEPTKVSTWSTRLSKLTIAIIQN